MIISNTQLHAWLHLIQFRLLVLLKLSNLPFLPHYLTTGLSWVPVSLNLYQPSTLASILFFASKMDWDLPYRGFTQCSICFIPLRLPLCHALFATHHQVGRFFWVVRRSENYKDQLIYNLRINSGVISQLTLIFAPRRIGLGGAMIASP